MATLTVKQDGSAQYTSLGAATTAAALGDTVEIQDSTTYAEVINLGSYIGGGWQKTVNYRALAGQTPIWDGTGRLLPAIDASMPLQAGGVPVIDLRGIKFTNWNYDSGVSGGVLRAGDDTAFQCFDCTFQSCATTVVNYMRGTVGSPTKLHRCKFTDVRRLIHKDGFQTDKYLEVFNCLVVPIAAYTVLSAEWTEARAYNCTVYAKPGGNEHGIKAGEVRNCIVVVPAGFSGNVAITATVQSSNCCVFGTWGTTFSGPQGSGNITVDPQFANASTSDFHLLTGSPCNNVGATLAEIINDLDTVVRPQGSAYDIGAYEFIAETSISVSADELARRRQLPATRHPNAGTFVRIYPTTRKA